MAFKTCKNLNLQETANRCVLVMGCCPGPGPQQSARAGRDPMPAHPAKRAVSGLSIQARMGLILEFDDFSLK